MQENPNDFLSIKEFAFKVKVHPNTIRRSIKSGRLSAFKIGSGPRAHYRIAATELNRIALVDMEEIIERIIEKRSKGV
jgi:excisionase family DNA binding protein